uniref:SAT domain-containing protein n=1 Tax=Globodera pallida TaxID=36090 RepID=A0A183BZU2_GLOPA
MFAPDVANIVRELDDIHLWASKCSKSVGELAVELVDYYALFAPLSTAISIQHGLTDNKQNATVKGRPKLNVYDPFHTASVCLHFLIFDHISRLEGLAEEFAVHAHSRDIHWANNLKWVNLKTPTAKFEQSPEEQQEGVVGWKMKDKFE